MVAPSHSPRRKEEQQQPQQRHHNYIPSSEILRCAQRRLSHATTTSKTTTTTTNLNSSPLDLEAVQNIWRAVALVIDKSLLSAGRGVRVESFGTFTLDATGRARFFFASEFMARHRLLKYDTTAGVCLAGAAVNAKLNVARVAVTAGCTRPNVERVVDAVLRSLRQRLSAGKAVTLSFHPVGEFACSPASKAEMRYLPAFRARQKAAKIAATTAKIGVGRTRARETAWAVASTVRASSSAGGGGGDDSATTGADGRSTRRSVGAAWQVELSRRPVLEMQGEASGQRPRSASTSATSRPSSTANLLRPGTTAVAARGSSGKPQNCTTAAAHSGSPPTAGTSTHRVASAFNRRCAWDKRVSDVGSVDGGKGTGKSSPPGVQTSLSSRESSPLLVPGSRAASGRGESHHKTNKSTLSVGTSPISRKDGVALINKANDEPAGTRSLRTDRVLSGEDRCDQQGPQEEQDWLMLGRLGQRVSEQVGKEGVRRLAETLRVMHLGDSNDGSGWRLSGRDLLQALRDVGGNNLTSRELAHIGSVFRKQRDGRVSLQRFLDTLPRDENTNKRFVPPPPAPLHPPAPPLSTPPLPPPPPQQHDSAEVSAAAISTAAVITSEVCSSSSTSGQTHNPPQSFREDKGDRESATSCQEQGTCDVRASHAQLQSDSGRSYQMMRGTCTVVGRSTAAVAHKDSTTMVPSARRAHAARGGRDGDLAGHGRAMGKHESNLIAELARIIYDPPCSLEGLIHVLQANKVRKQYQPSARSGTLDWIGYLLTLVSRRKEQGNTPVL